MSDIQNELFKEIRTIQEEAVYEALAENPDIEKLLFEVTYDTVFKLLDIFDGYRNTELDLDIVDRKSGVSINKSRNLHDLCETFLHTGDELKIQKTLKIVNNDLFFHFHIRQNVKTVFTVCTNGVFVFFFDLKAKNCFGVIFFNKSEKLRRYSFPAILRG